jgi:hypothetical protein
MVGILGILGNIGISGISGIPYKHSNKNHIPLPQD